MHWKHGFLPLFCLAASVPALGAGRSAVPPASFLNYHVANVHELSQEVTLDPMVRMRLARHFHLTEPTMTSYLRRNLSLSRLKTAGAYQVACVRPNGTEYWVTEHLPAGTPIFASRITGQPILKLACGNPLVSALPATAVSSSLSGTAQMAQTPMQPQTAALMTPELMSAAEPTNTVLAFEDDSAQNDAYLLPVVQTAGSFQSLGNLSSAAGSSHALNFAPEFAGLVGAAALFHQGNSGHFNGSSAPPPPAPVPELSPSLSLGALLLLGSVTLLILRRKRTNNTSK